MLTVLLIFTIGLALSAFFSGSETGFYRVSRVRLLIDALAGDWIAKGLMRASNNPAAFVATALVGNNVANNVTAMSVVMATGLYFPGVAMAELLTTLAITPVVFICGELLPKQLFFRAPYRMLRRCAPGLVVAAILFAPFSLLLWLVSRLLQWIGRAPSQTIRMALARRELSEVLDEGHAVGLLTPAQRSIAQGTFALGDQPISEFMVAASRQTKANTSMTPRGLLELAARQKQPALPVEDTSSRQSVVGYVVAVDCLLNPTKGALPLRPLMEAQESENYLSVLLRLQAAGEPLLAVRSAEGPVVGYVTTARLRGALLEEN